MLAFRRPSDEYLREFVKEQRDQAFSYAEVGASYGKTRDNCDDLKAAGYDVDHHRIRLGVGQRCFDAAVQAVREWKMHRFASWVEIIFPDVPIFVGETVAILAYHGVSYTLSACKIVYTVDEMEEDGSIQRFGFAYGTTAKHAERGEERFLIEWDRLTDSVYYDILAFSRPQTWFVRLGYPVARIYQSLFANSSLQAMARAVEEKENSTK